MTAWQDSKAPQTPKLATLESAMSMAPRRCFAPPSKFLVDDTPLEENTILLGLLLPFFGGEECVVTSVLKGGCYKICREILCAVFFFSLVRCYDGG